MIRYFAIKNNDGVIDRLTKLGYKKCKNINYSIPMKKWIFIIMSGGENHGNFIGGYFHSTYDLEVNIDDVPLRKDFDEFIQVILNGIKLGLL